MKTTEVINECIPISNEAKIDGCSSALTTLKAKVKTFNISNSNGGKPKSGQVSGKCLLNECTYGLGSAALSAQVGKWGCKDYKLECDLNKKAIKDGTYQEWRGLVKKKKWANKTYASFVYNAWDKVNKACGIKVR